MATATYTPTTTPTRIPRFPANSLRSITPEPASIEDLTAEEVANSGLNTFQFICEAYNGCGCANTEQFTHEINFSESGVTIGYEGMGGWPYMEIGRNLYYSEFEHTTALILFEADGHKSEFWRNGELCSIQEYRLDK